MTSWTGLLAFDIDGTLIRSDGSVSSRVVDALGHVREAGYLTACATGRPWSMAQPVIEAVGGMDYGVCLNGAVVIDGTSGDTLRHAVMTREQAVAAAAAVRSVVDGAALGADMADGRHIWEVGFDPHMPLDLEPHRVDDAVEHIDGSVLTWLIGSALHSTAAVIDLVAPLLPAGLEIHPSGLDTAEITLSGVSKASGLELVADRHELGAEHVVAFGDGANDVEMFRWAGRAVAMENGTEALKHLAHHVAPSNDDDGVAYFLSAHL